MDHIDIAIQAVVHQSNITPKEIALRAGIGYQVLLNKANPNDGFNKLTLRESLAIQMATDNYAIQRAVELELKRSQKITPAECVIQAALRAAKEHGDVISAVQKSLEDNRFTLKEREECQREIDEAIKALQQLSATIVAHK